MEKENGNRSMITPAIFRINNDTLEIKFGSGFLINQNIVLTCWHCVKNFSIGSSLNLTDETLKDNEGLLIASDPDSDLALIRLQNHFTDGNAVFTNRWRKRETIRVRGFNSSFDNKPLDTIGNIQFANYQHIAFNGDKIIDGYSGGPLINDENGCVIGIVNLTKNNYYPEGGIAISHHEIEKFCMQSGIIINYQKSTNENIAALLHAEMKKELDKIEVFFSRMISSKGTQVTDEGLTAALYSSKNTCSIIWGIGGLGKSILLKKIITDFTSKDSEGFHIYLNVKDWQANRTNDIKKNTTFDVKVEHLLMGFQSPFTAKQLETSERKYIYLDGANEFADSELRRSVLDLLNYMSRQFGATVIVTSRYLDSELKGWISYIINKIDSVTLSKLLTDKFGTVGKLTQKNLDYLSIPFFLNIALLNSSPDIKSYSDFIYTHTLKNIPDAKKEAVLDELSKLAFDNYFTPERFRFSESDINILAADLCVQDEILRQREDHFAFEHHLIYEFFVANQLSKSSNFWNRNTYDVASLDNKMSFELMQMTLEKMPSEQDGEKLLLSLYDWSFYATLHCLWYVDRQDKYPEQLAKALILLLSEKLYDRFMHTRNQVVKYLERLYNKFNIIGLSGSFNSDNILTLSNEKAAEAYRIIINQNAPSFLGSAYEEWYTFFSREFLTLEENDLKQIKHESSIRGWSTANVIRRHTYSDKNELQLRTMLEFTEDNIIKWRIVHAMGQCRENDSVEALMNTLINYPYKWVKYGAIRSLMEIVIFGLDLESASTLLHRIFEVFKTHTFDETVIEEFRTCLATQMSEDKVAIVNAEIETFRTDIIDSDTTTKWRETYEQFRKYNPE
jgi:hypothetical protein